MLSNTTRKSRTTIARKIATFSQDARDRGEGPALILPPRHAWRRFGLCPRVLACVPLGDRSYSADIPLHLSFCLLHSLQTLPLPRSHTPFAVGLLSLIRRRRAPCWPSHREAPSLGASAGRGDRNRARMDKELSNRADKTRHAGERRPNIFSEGRSSSSRSHPKNPWISNSKAARMLIFLTRHRVPES